MWDLIVIGGGSSGVGAAISASRQNLKTLIIEKMGFLGGTATASLVTPMMGNLIDKDHNLTNGIYLEVLSRLKSTGHSAIHENGNPGWFDPVMLKCVLDDICEENGVEVLFDTVVTDVRTENNKILSVKCFNKSGFSLIDADFFIDATGDADISAFAGVPYQSGEKLCEKNNCEISHQSMSLRFIMSGVNVAKLAHWLEKIDPDSGVSSVCYDENGQILLTTAYAETKGEWKLKSFFDEGVQEGILKPEDKEYFQIFSIPGQKNAIAFNCPRIYAEKSLDPLNMWDLSYAQKTGRKQIRRIAGFCKKYFPGFEEACISEIAPLMGIRDFKKNRGNLSIKRKRHY